MAVLNLVNLTLDTSVCSAKDRTGVFFFRYISVVKNTLLLVSEEGEERCYKLENRFERNAISSAVTATVSTRR